MADPLLFTIRKAIINKMRPITSEQGGLLRKIHEVSFNDVEDVGTVLDKYENELPAGFLSLGAVAYKSEELPSNAVAVDAEFFFSFAGVQSGEATPSDRLMFSDKLFDLFNDNVMGATFENVGIATDKTVRQLTGADCSVLDNDKYFGRLWTGLTVRVWFACTPNT